MQIIQDPDICGKKIIGGGVEVYAVGPTVDYEKGIYSTDTLLPLEGADFQTIGGEINKGACAATGWICTDKNEIQLTGTDTVRGENTFVIIINPIIFES